jgi:hypothetical protein
MTERDKELIDKLGEIVKQLDTDNLEKLTLLAQGMAIGENLNKAG